jgi:hypothetical protein
MFVLTVIGSILPRRWEYGKETMIKKSVEITICSYRIEKPSIPFGSRI